MIIELPFPPSLNNYRSALVINGRARLVTSKAGRLYHQAVMEACLVQRVGKPLQGPLACTLDLYPPTNARRDCDNFCKSLLDGLTSANVFNDDSQIIDLRIRMHPKRAPGSVTVTLEEIRAEHCAHNQLELVATA